MFSKTYAAIGLFLICSLAMFQTVFAQNSSNGAALSSNGISETPTDKLVKVQRFLNIYASIGKFSGVAILAHNGKPIHKFTTKYSTLDFKIRCALSTQFNTCDITQAFTATAIMQLVEQGKIGLNDKIGQYLFKLPPQVGQAITIHQLLTHTSGLGDYYNLEEYREHFYDIQDMEILVNLTMKYPLDFAPGTQVKKSTIGYLLLGNLIEQVSGVSYDDYVQKNIFEHNDMKQSGVYSWFDPAEQQAVGYLPNRKGESKEAPEYWGAHAFGADALHCSIEDLLKFNNAFQSGKMLSQKARNLMVTPHYTSSENTQEQIGYGWKIKEVGGQKAIYQGSALGGLSSALRHYTRDGYTVLIFSNFGDNTANIVANKIERILTTNNETVPNHAASYITYDLINEKGVDYVKNNFDEIIQKNNLEIKDMWPFYSLGQNYLKENKPTTALTVFQLGVKKYPNAPMLYDAMGDCYHQLQNKAMAKQSFERKLQLKPGDQRAKRMLEVIESTTYANVQKTSPTGSQQILVNNQTSNKPKQTFVKASYKPTATKSNTPTSTSTKVHTTVEVMPEFPGGQSALHQYIYQNLRYPTIAYINAIEGTIYIDCVVDSYGNIIDAQVNKTIEGNDGGLSLEAMRIVNSMPRWTPGTHQGAEVMVKLTIPIQFNKGNFMKGADSPER
ncbi:MAG: serine hydrolase [Chitinophagales bacterium]